MTFAKYTLLGLVALGLVAAVSAVPPWAGNSNGNNEWRGSMMQGQQMMHQAQQAQEHMPEDARERMQEHRAEMQELIVQGVNEGELQEFRDQNRAEALERQALAHNESSNTTNNERFPDAGFPGNGMHFGPPAFVADMVPDHALNRMPGWLFG